MFRDIDRATLPKIPTPCVMQERIGYLLKRSVGRPSLDVRGSLAVPKVIFVEVLRLIAELRSASHVNSRRRCVSRVPSGTTGDCAVVEEESGSQRPTCRPPTWWPLSSWEPRLPGARNGRDWA